MIAAPICPYCGISAKLSRYKGVHDNGHLWVCIACGARVGCHPGSKVPLGTLANAELRSARMEAHNAFDPRWRGAANRFRARTDAYAWLASQMGLKIEDCHIALFDLQQCRRVVELCTLAAFADLA